MNRNSYSRAKTSVYDRMAQLVVRAIQPFFGLIATGEIIDSIFRTTKPIVDASRKEVQAYAYRDYVAFVEEDPVERLELNRFTDGLWAGSLEKRVEVGQPVTEKTAEDVALAADYWTRDAEWGQRYDAAKRDSRIWKVARVDRNPPSCPFCTMLNSRGAIYLSQESAARTLHVGDECELVYVRKGQKTYPGKESNDEALRRYEQAVKDAPDNSPEEIMKALRAQDPNRPAGRVQRNVRKVAEDSKAAELKAVRARLATLEKMNPTTDTARAYKAAQLERNRKILSALEA